MNFPTAAVLSIFTILKGGGIAGHAGELAKAVVQVLEYAVSMAFGASFADAPPAAKVGSQSPAMALGALASHADSVASGQPQSLPIDWKTLIVALLEILQKAIAAA
jgi:hypothetical protein